MALTPSSVYNKNNECGTTDVNIFNNTYFQDNFCLPQSTPTGKVDGHGGKTNNMMICETFQESIVVGCGDPLEGYDYT
jgi:hypothetical protein